MVIERVSSFRTSVSVSYISQAYVSMVGILVMPVYLRLMGAEAYGLVGFFTMLQAWFQLLDFGLSPTLTRECSRFAAGAVSATQLRGLVRVLELLFLAIGATAAVCLWVGSEWIASEWVNSAGLSTREIAHVIQLMALALACRWMSGLYRGALAGLERLVWLGSFNVVVATARFVLVVPVLLCLGPTPSVFFTYQIVVAIIESVVLLSYMNAKLPIIEVNPISRLDLLALKSSLRFSLTIAFTGAVWVAVTQTDKLVLSSLLPLDSYAHVTIAILLASSILIACAPLSSALIPRLSRLNAQSLHEEFVALYRNATQGIAILASSMSLVLSICANDILFAWTGNRLLAENYAEIVRLYSIGNGILSLAAFPYYLQFAKGDVRMHLYGNIAFLVVLTPTIVFATVRFGAVGAGWAWVAANALYAAVWTPFVHGRFLPGFHSKWLKNDVAAIVLPTTIITLFIAEIVGSPNGRLHAGVLALGIWLSAFLSAMCFSSSVREMFRVRLKTRRLRTEAAGKSFERGDFP